MQLLEPAAPPSLCPETYPFPVLGEMGGRLQEGLLSSKAHTQHRTLIKLCMHLRPEEQDVRAGVGIQEQLGNGPAIQAPRGQQVLSDTSQITWPLEDAERPSEGLMVSRTSEGAGSRRCSFSLYPCEERFSPTLLVKEIKSPVWMLWKEHDCQMAWAGITVEYE